MLATSGRLPESAGWAVEWKWDAVRAVVAVSPEGPVRANSRNDRDITRSYPELEGLAEVIDEPVLLDGELVALDEQGRPSFGRLQSRMHVTAPTARLLRATPVLFYAFDLLHCGGEPLLSSPYLRRRHMLLELGLSNGPVRTPSHYTDVSGTRMLELAREHGLEGVVSKRLDSTYQPGQRSSTWVKTPLRYTQEVVLGGWTAGEGRRSGTLGSALLGAHDDRGNLVYIGQVGTGLTQRMLVDLLGQLESLERATSPFDTPVPRERARRARWVDPVLVGEVEYREISSEGFLRHPSWRGLRSDKQPVDVRTRLLEQKQ